MRFLHTLVRGLRTQPRYTLMRTVARFTSVREAVAGGRALIHREAARRWLADCESQMSGSVFSGLDRVAFVRELRQDGIAFGLQLPSDVVAAIRAYAQAAPTFADRRPGHGFLPKERPLAEQRLGKPILLSQYFNTRQDCPAIDALVRDPALRWIAGAYLGSVPTFFGTNLWWTYPVDALPEDRNLHAHLFHRDVDDFRFFKFFFYLTDVETGEGGHVLVRGSHRHTPPARGLADRWNLRRYGDNEVREHYAASDVLEITGKAGTGFAENTLCIHKGRTPVSSPRLLLQLQYGLFDYGNMSDERDAAQLSLLR